MSSDAGRLPSDFAAVIEKAGLKPWEFLAMDVTTFDPAKVRLAAVFLHAAWSGRSAQLLRELRQTLNKLGADRAPRLVVLDADALVAGQVDARFGGAAPEWGETLWIVDGHIVRRFTRRNTPADAEEFLTEFAQLLAERLKTEQAHCAERRESDKQALHGLHELPESTLKVPDARTFNGPDFGS